MISPRAAYCWTACKILVKRGPKQRRIRNFPATRRSISAVSRITSLVSGGEPHDRSLHDLKVAFCSLERSASNSETAFARRMSAFSRAAVANAADMMSRLRFWRHTSKTIRLNLNGRRCVAMGGGSFSTRLGARNYLRSEWERLSPNSCEPISQSREC